MAPETAFTGDEWIRDPTKPLLTHKQSRKTESLTTQIVTETVSRDDEGILSAHSTC
jgi:hypothetical protein